MKTFRQRWRSVLNLGDWTQATAAPLAALLCCPMPWYTGSLSIKADYIASVKFTSHCIWYQISGSLLFSFHPWQSLTISLHPFPDVFKTNIILSTHFYLAHSYHSIFLSNHWFMVAAVAVHGTNQLKTWIKIYQWYKNHELWINHLGEFCWPK